LIPSQYYSKKFVIKSFTRKNDRPFVLYFESTQLMERGRKKRLRNRLYTVSFNGVSMWRTVAMRKTNCEDLRRRKRKMIFKIINSLEENWDVLMCIWYILIRHFSSAGYFCNEKHVANNESTIRTRNYSPSIDNVLADYYIPSIL